MKTTPEMVKAWRDRNCPDCGHPMREHSVLGACFHVTTKEKKDVYVDKDMCNCKRMKYPTLVIKNE